MTYNLEVSRPAEKHIRRLPADLLPKIIQRILQLRDDPRPPGVKKLVGDFGWRIRVGDWRIIYEIDDDRQLITVIAVKPRQSAYR